MTPKQPAKQPAPRQVQTSAKDDSFLVFGSVLKREVNAKDTDLVIPEFVERADGAAVSLDRYERLSHETSKPIDLFFTTYESNFNVAGWYDPQIRKWEFRMAFCGVGFFGLVKRVHHSELVAMTLGKLT